MFATVKASLKSDIICQSYAQMKKGSSFLTHSIYFVNMIVCIGYSVFIARQHTDAQY